MGSVLGAASAAAACGAGICAYGALYPQAQLFGPTMRRTPSAKQFALTFDDGPNPAATPRLLDLLDRHRVRATFFLIGSRVRAYPELAREAATRGHQICNHTDTHPNLFWLGPARLRRELTDCQGAIADAIGHTPRWMRPPFGVRSPFLDNIAREMGFRAIVMWTLIPGDWKRKPEDWLIARMRPIAEHIEHSSNGNDGGDILVLHDGDHRFPNADREHMLHALAYWLPRWRDAGLEFVTIEDVTTREAS